MRTGGKEELSDDDTRLKKLNFIARASKNRHNATTAATVCTDRDKIIFMHIFLFFSENSFPLVRVLCNERVKNLTSSRE